MSLSYLFVRKDLPSFISNPESQSLLVAFLKAFYDENYIGECRDEFGFVPITGDLRELALEGIEMLETSPEAPTWIFEGDTVLTEGGQGDYVISKRRKHAYIVEQDLLEDRADKMEDALKVTLSKIDELEATIRRLEAGGQLQETSGSGDEANYVDELDSDVYDDDEAKRLDAAFIMGIVSLSCWVLVGCCALYSTISASGIQGQVQDDK